MFVLQLQGVVVRLAPRILSINATQLRIELRAGVEQRLVGIVIPNQVCPMSANVGDAYGLVGAHLMLQLKVPLGNHGGYVGGKQSNHANACRRS